MKELVSVLETQGAVRNAKTNFLSDSVHGQGCLVHENPPP